MLNSQEASGSVWLPYSLQSFTWKTSVLVWLPLLFLDEGANQPQNGEVVATTTPETFPILETPWLGSGHVPRVWLGLKYFIFSSLLPKITGF